MILTGIDIETTGTSVAASHRLIQIGIVTADGLIRINRDVQPCGNIYIDEVALQINGFTLARIGAAHNQFDVDNYIVDRLRDAGYTYADLIPVGWNVGVFDMKFIAKELPLTCAYFRYGHPYISAKTVDLNSIAIYLAEKLGRDLDSLKSEIKAKVKARMGFDKSHDAMYDAEAALVALSVMEEEF